MAYYSEGLPVLMTRLNSLHFLRARKAQIHNSKYLYILVQLLTIQILKRILIIQYLSKKALKRASQFFLLIKPKIQLFIACGLF